MESAKMTPVSISTDQSRLNLPWVLAQLRGTYWASVRDEQKTLEALRNSVCFGVYQDEVLDGGEIALTGRQVAFARVVTDGAVFSSVMDVVVDEGLRRRGIGSLLMREVVSHPSVAGTVCILSTRDAAGFYERHGFTLGAQQDVMRRVGT